MIQNFSSSELKVLFGVPPDEETRLVYLSGFGHERFAPEIVVAFAGLPPSICSGVSGYGSNVYEATVWTGKH